MAWTKVRRTLNIASMFVTLETSHPVRFELNSVAPCPHTSWVVSRVERWHGPEARPGILSGKDALMETDRKCAHSRLDATHICGASAAMW